MQQLNIIQGDSVTIALTLPIEKMDALQDLSVYLGGSEVAKLSTNTLISTVDENIFLVKLTSKQTSNIVGKHELVLAFDYSDIGVKKVKDLFTLNISTTGNKFSNTSTSNVISINITFTIIETAISGSSELVNVAVGNGISSITLLTTVGNLKTYRILYTDGTHFDFVVTDGINGTNGTNGTNGANGTNGVDGNGIQNIVLLSTVGLVKTYRITFTNSSTFDFVVTDGAQGIQGIQGAQGVAGANGTNGTNGLSAYEIALQEGYVGTQSQWNNDNKNRTFINTLILG